MKKIFVWALSLLFSTLAIESVSAKGDALRMAVVADVHIMAPALVVSEGEAFNQYVQRDRKMLLESTALLDRLIDELLSESPEVVLFAGDLTKDGESVSHQHLIEKGLNRLSEAGIATYVVPGNHDVYNPHAVSFDNDDKARVATPTAEEFADLYINSGYGTALSRDENSLTYISQIAPKVRLLAIDACRYDDNDFEADDCHHDGRIKASTWEFIERELKDAEAQGMRVIGLMHHGVVEHWKYQNAMIPGYIIEEWESSAKRLRKAGVEVVFTGHSHTQDVSTYKGLYDVQTGSTVSYPCPYRIVTLDDEKMQIESRLIKEIDYDLGGKSLAEFSRENIVNGFKFYLIRMFPEDIPSEITQPAADFLALAMASNYAGDESLTKELSREIKMHASQIRKYSLKWSLIFKRVATALYVDPAVADNDITIEFKEKR